MEILLVHSYKGGSGKSLASLNLAKSLVEEEKKRVLIIEADFSMPSFIYVFDKINPDVYFNEYLNDHGGQLKNYIYKDEQSNLDLVFCSPNITSTDKIFGFDDNWYLEVRHKLMRNIEELENNYDYIIFDLGPGKNYFTIIALDISGYVVLMIRLDSSSKFGSYELLNSFYSNALTKDKKFLILFNQVPNHELISETLNDWIAYFSVFNKLDISFDHIFYSDETAYHIIETGILLPNTDMVYKSIKRCWNNFSRLNQIG